MDLVKWMGENNSIAYEYSRVFPEGQHEMFSFFYWKKARGKGVFRRLHRQVDIRQVEQLCHLVGLDLTLLRCPHRPLYANAFTIYPSTKVIWRFSCSWPHSLNVLMEFCNSIMYMVVPT